MGDRTIEVFLTDEEIEKAENIGVKTQTYNTKRGVKDQKTVNGTRGYRWHQIGAVCEKACSKGLKIPWYREIGNYKHSDVGPFEVRATTWEAGKLRLNKGKTRLGAIYILVIDMRPKFILAGWIIAEDGMKDKYWGRHYHGVDAKCWGVPQEDLRPMSELVEMVTPR